MEIHINSCWLQKACKNDSGCIVKNTTVPITYSSPPIQISKTCRPWREMFKIHTSFEFLKYIFNCIYCCTLQYGKLVCIQKWDVSCCWWSNSKCLVTTCYLKPYVADRDWLTVCVWKCRENCWQFIYKFGSTESNCLYVLDCYFKNNPNQKAFGDECYDKTICDISADISWKNQNTVGLMQVCSFKLHIFLTCCGS